MKDATVQMGCVHYVATEQREGLPNASKIFYEAYALYQTDVEKFDRIAKEFYCKYDK